MTTTTTTTTDSSASAPTNNTVHFVVTGFGPFQNAKENPTTIIANNLVDYLHSIEKDHGASSLLAARTTTRVIETSAQAARKELDDLIPTSPPNHHHTVVYLHLGVNYMGTHFQLEQCGYNDATFRIPDEQGYQPRNKCINEDCTLGTLLETKLDCHDICEHLSDEASLSSSVIVSTDPGRFVCNYTYYYSLTKTQHDKQVHSLFVHVPPFSKVPQEEQLKTIVAIMNCIDSQLSNQ
jgi:pyroglutamyl-peptidase